jgi:hypothetical protein
MSRLNFASIDQAFQLGSKNITDTQEEIANLKKILSGYPNPKKEPDSDKSKEPKDQEQKKNSTSPSELYERIGPPDKVSASFNTGNTTKQDTFDTDILRVISHPRFDDIVTNYIALKRPELANAQLQQTNYTGQSGVSYFGNRYNSTVCSDVKKYISFFIFCIIVFICLTVAFK